MEKLETRDLLFLLYFRMPTGGRGQDTSRESTLSRNLLPHQVPKKKRAAQTIRKKKGVQTMATISPKKEVLTDSTPFCFTKHTRRKHVPLPFRAMYSFIGNERPILVRIFRVESEAEQGTLLNLELRKFIT